MKRYGLILLCAAMVLTVSGCGKGKAGKEAEEAVDKIEEELGEDLDDESREALENLVKDARDYDNGEGIYADEPESEEPAAGSNHFDIDDRLKNSSLKDGYTQFGDMVFQGLGKMTVDDVKAVIESSSCGLTANESTDKNGLPIVKVTDDAGEEPIKFIWASSTEEHNLGQTGTNYLLSAYRNNPTSAYDDKSVYYGPFQYRKEVVDEVYGEGLYDGEPLTKSRLMDYLNKDGALDKTDANEGEIGANVFFPYCYDNTDGFTATNVVIPQTTVCVSDYSFSDLTDEDGNPFILCVIYRFTWNDDESVGSISIENTVGGFVNSLFIKNE